MLRTSEAGMKTLADYRLEEMLWSEQSWHLMKKKEERKPEELIWRHRVQYAISHAVNDYYTLLPEVRREVSIYYLLEKRWPRHAAGFDSINHYWEVKNKVASELTRSLLQRVKLTYPTLLFEESSVFVPELRMNLSVIFHTAWQLDEDQSSGLTLHKYMVSYHSEVIYAYQQLMTVFCVQAFGQLPKRIEVDCLMEGKRVSFSPQEHDYLLAIDYVKLASPLCHPPEEEVDCLSYEYC